MKYSVFKNLTNMRVSSQDYAATEDLLEGMINLEFLQMQKNESCLTFLSMAV